MDALAQYFANLQARRDAMSKPELRKWLAELEKERQDTSWKRPHKCPPVNVVKITETKLKPAKQRLRDQVMFHAGRYTAGARDEKAAKAAKQLQKLLRSEGKQ